MFKSILKTVTVSMSLIILACVDDGSMPSDTVMKDIIITYDEMAVDAEKSSAPKITSSSTTDTIKPELFNWRIIGGEEFADIDMSTGVITVTNPTGAFGGRVKVRASWNFIPSQGEGGEFIDPFIDAYVSTKQGSQFPGFPAWDGSEITPVKEVDNRYDIYKPSQLAWVMEKSKKYNFDGKTIRFLEDIDMGSHGVQYIYQFAGTIEGNSKRLSNIGLHSVNGIISKSSGDVVIDSLIVSSGPTNGFYAGSFVGEATGNLTIRNCTNYADVVASTSSSTSTGGFVGEISGDLIIINSVNHGTVSSSYLAGGLVGEAKGNLTIEDSVNNKNVQGKQLVGGLVGRVDDGEKLTIKNSINNGALSSLESNYVYIGGLVGNSGNTLTTILDSSNTGNLTGVFEGDNSIGGLVGSTTNQLIIDNSSNSGVVANIYDKYSSSGGLVGMLAEKYGVPQFPGNILTVSNSSNSASVRGNRHVGGIVGHHSNSAKTVIISNSVNSGAVSGDQLMGGLVGYTNGTVKIDNSSNTGDITATGGDIGGLIGYSNTCFSSTGRENLIVSNSFNSGTIRGTDIVGGIIGTGDYADVGECGDLAISLTNVFNYAKTIEGVRKGGLIGAKKDDANLSINNSYWLKHDGLPAVGVGTITSSTNVNELTADQFKSDTNFDGWDFGKIWELITAPETLYPTLQVLKKKPKNNLDSI